MEIKIIKTCATSYINREFLTIMALYYVMTSLSITYTKLKILLSYNPTINLIGLSHSDKLKLNSHKTCVWILEKLYS